MFFSFLFLSQSTKPRISRVKYPSVGVISSHLEELFEITVSTRFAWNDPWITTNGCHECSRFKIPSVSFGYLVWTALCIREFQHGSECTKWKSLQSLCAVKWTFLQYRYITISVWCKLFDSVIEPALWGLHSRYSYTTLDKQSNRKLLQKT